MSIPQYHIARVVVEEHMQRQLNEDPHNQKPRRPERREIGIKVNVRKRLSAAIYALAAAIEPPQRTPDCEAAQQA